METCQITYISWLASSTCLTHSICLPFSICLTCSVRLTCSLRWFDLSNLPNLMNLFDLLNLFDLFGLFYTSVHNNLQLCLHVQFLFFQDAFNFFVGEPFVACFAWLAMQIDFFRLALCSFNAWLRFFKVSAARPFFISFFISAFFFESSGPCSFSPP